MSFKCIQMPKETILAYFAGFYEGEGYVYNDKSNNNRIRLVIDQNVTYFLPAFTSSLITCPLFSSEK